MARETAQNDEQADLPVAEAEGRRGQDQCGAPPIPEDEGAAPPRRGDIASLGWMKLQVFSRELPTAQQSHGVRLDFVPTFRMNSVKCSIFPGEAVCALYATSAADLAFSISFLHIVLGCHGCRAGYGAQLLVRCLCGFPTMWTQWQGVFFTTR
ncbi:hypothetical protein TcCL_ESM01112 [Trypanosoma cruzi]|nr:hypothetical protein TcCL_ESM01112 [Trypanosoma cruzi]